MIYVEHAFVRVRVRAPPDVSLVARAPLAAVRTVTGQHAWFAGQRQTSSLWHTSAAAVAVSTAQTLPYSLG